MIAYSEIFWTNFLQTFLFVIGAVLGLLPALLLVLSTIVLATLAFHRRQVQRLDNERARIDGDIHEHALRITSERAEGLKRERRLGRWFSGRGGAGPADGRTPARP